MNREEVRCPFGTIELKLKTLKSGAIFIRIEYLELDALAAPNGYVAPPTQEDLAYVVHFRKTCQRYQIDFAKADRDERNFVIHMSEKTFFQKRA